MSVPEFSDGDLIARVAHGDREAITILYQRYSPSMLALALRMLRQRSEAEDVLQDVFVEIWNRAGDFDARKSSVKSWMYLRLRCRCLDRIKSPRLARRTRLTTDQSATLQDNSPSSEAAAEAKELRGAMARLPETFRVILMLGYFEGLSSREIGERLKIPTGTVKSRASRAVKELRSLLESQTRQGQVS